MSKSNAHAMSHVPCPMSLHAVSAPHPHLQWRQRTKPHSLDLWAGVTRAPGLPALRMRVADWHCRLLYRRVAGTLHEADTCHIDSSNTVEAAHLYMYSA